MDLGETKPEQEPLQARQLSDADIAIGELFTFHAPDADQKMRYDAIRSSARELAHLIFDYVPAGPDRTAAIRKVREAVMTANAGIATRNAAARVR